MNVTSVVGFILPPVIDLINSKIGNSKVKWAISMGICVIVGFLLNINELSTSPQSVLGNIGLVFASAQTTYALYYKNSNVRTNLLNKING